MGRDTYGFSFVQPGTPQSGEKNCPLGLLYESCEEPSVEGGVWK